MCTVLYNVYCTLYSTMCTVLYCTVLSLLLCTALCSNVLICVIQLHSGVQCITVQCAVHYSDVYYSVVYYSDVYYSAVCSALQCSVQCTTVYHWPLSLPRNKVSLRMSSNCFLLINRPTTEAFLCCRAVRWSSLSKGWRS